MGSSVTLVSFSLLLPPNTKDWKAIDHPLLSKGAGAAFSTLVQGVPLAGHFIGALSGVGGV